MDRVRIGFGSRCNSPKLSKNTRLRTEGSLLLTYPNSYKLKFPKKGHKKAPESLVAEAFLLYLYMQNTCELWKIIDAAPEYEISSIGRVKNKNGRILKHFDYEGYNKIKLVNPVSKQRKVYLVHRLVALAFIPRDLGKPEVNHKNKIRNDNRVSNLEWVDRSGNMKNVFRDMVSINFVIKTYINNKNISPSEFKQLLLKKPRS